MPNKELNNTVDNKIDEENKSLINPYNVKGWKKFKNDMQMDEAIASAELAGAELNNTVDNKIDWEEEYPINTFTQETRDEIMDVVNRAIKQREDEIIKVLSKEYNRALKENEFGESNAYAHSIAIVRKF